VSALNDFQSGKVTVRYALGNTLDGCASDSARDHKQFIVSVLSLSQRYILHRTSMELTNLGIRKMRAELT
jgi:hypothetical protein